jgi:hypothetical protein
MTERKPPRLLIYDYEVKGPYHKAGIVEMAESIGWQPMPFDKIDIALEEFDDSIDALVTKVPDQSEVLKSDGPFPAKRLIARSDELDVPRAMISKNTIARKFIRQNSSDVWIPNNSQSPNKIVAWLLLLTTIE